MNSAACEMDPGAASSDMRAALFGLGLLIACNPAHSPDHTTLAETLQAETVALVQITPDDQHVYCSGVWVGRHEILTAAHCTTNDEDTPLPMGTAVDYATADDVSLLNGEPHYVARPAKLVARDEERDLALLLTDHMESEHGVASVGSEPRAGQRVFAEGAPLGLGWSFSSGDVMAIRIAGSTGATDKPLAYVQATTPISPGSSGCGLYDEDGGLIGIAQGYLRSGENLNLFIHRDHVVAFLENAHAGAR